jgi:hypothetical protein
MIYMFNNSDLVSHTQKIEKEEKVKQTQTKSRQHSFVVSLRDT